MHRESMIAKHRMRAPCPDSCKRKCFSKFSESQRQKLNTEFWNLSWYERRIFISSGVKRHAVTRKTAGPDSKRSLTFHYFLCNEMGEELSVCKRFYLATLGFQPSNDAVVQKALHSLGSGSLLPKPDGRGSGTHCAIDRNKIRAHIESFSPSISHYRREHAPHMRYLPSAITIDGMHKDFLQKNPNMTCSYEVYRTEVKKMCISFTKLGHEECELCEAFSLHSAEHTRDNLNQTCDVCIKWQNHIRKAGESRQEYRNDSATENCNSSHVMFSADLQKVIMLPRMESIKTVLFTHRIMTFNESFVPLGDKTTEKPVAVLWHEAVAGRKKEDIVSAFHAFLLARRDAA